MQTTLTVKTSYTGANLSLCPQYCTAGLGVEPRWSVRVKWLFVGWVFAVCLQYTSVLCQGLIQQPEALPEEVPHVRLHGNKRIAPFLLHALQRDIESAFFFPPRRLCFLCFVDKTTTMNKESEIHHYFTNSSVEINGVPFHTLRQMTFEWGHGVNVHVTCVTPPPSQEQLHSRQAMAPETPRTPQRKIERKSEIL